MRTLIVEDEPLIARLISRYLSGISSQTIVVDTMAAAEEVIAGVDPFDIITLDLNLPDSRGPDTLSKIKVFKQHHPNALLIVVTGVLTREDEMEVLRQGGDGLMLKVETMGSEGSFLKTLGDIVRSIKRVPERFTKNVELLEKIAVRIASHLNEGT